MRVKPKYIILSWIQILGFDELHTARSHWDKEMKRPPLVRSGRVSPLLLFSGTWIAQFILFPWVEDIRAFSNHSLSPGPIHSTPSLHQLDSFIKLDQSACFLWNDLHPSVNHSQNKDNLISSAIEQECKVSWKGLVHESSESRDTSILTASVDGFFLKRQVGPLLLCLLYLPWDYRARWYWLNLGTLILDTTHARLQH